MASDTERAKICTGCGASGPEANFKGRSLKCAACRKTYRAAHYAANRERTLAVNKAWAQRNPENVKERSARWHRENFERHQALNAAWYERNRDAHLKRGRDWYERNKEGRKAQIAFWRSQNPERCLAAIARYRRRWPERCREQQKSWGARNPHIIREQAMRRYATKTKATPKWLTSDHKTQISKFYEAAVLLEIVTGVPHQVDHIVPLRGKYVCGLHVPWNLQVLTQSENARKGNRFEG